nr:MAG TPA: TRL10 protein [Crassvirales sp.]
MLVIFQVSYSLKRVKNDTRRMGRSNPMYCTCNRCNMGYMYRI